MEQGSSEAQDLSIDSGSTPETETTSSNDDLGGISSDLLQSLGIETESKSESQPEAEQEESEEGLELEQGTTDHGEEVEGKAEASSELYEIVHDGVKRNLSLEELKSHAQKGFDYTSKTMTLADQRKEWETKVESEKVNLDKQVEVLQSRQKELTDVLQMKDQWDFYVDALEKSNPDLFEEIQTGFQETTKHFNNPVVSAQLNALNEKMAQYDQAMQERQNTQIVGEFEKSLEESKGRWSEDFEKLGLKMDDEKIKEAYVNGAATVDDAVINTYGSDIIKLLKSKTKVNATAKKVQANKKVPTAGTQNVAKKAGKKAEGTRINGKLRGYGDILNQVTREYLN